MIEEICNLIAAAPQRLITFCEFMEQCLYHPQYGYYTGAREKIGKSGDFYTSSALGGLLAECVAHYVNTIMPPAQPLRFVEWGGGTGQFAAQFLHALHETAPHTYARMRYTMIEKSATLRALQQTNTVAHAPRVEWLDEQEWYEQAPHEQVFLFCNELLDAFAVHRIECQDGHLFERYVGWNGDAFYETAQPLADRALLDYIAKHEILLQDGQIAECNVQAPRWLAAVAQSLANGHLMIIDYGDLREELYGPHRPTGTLMCYRQHVAHDRPLEHIGEQDLTAHVDFSAVMRTGADLGLTTVQYGPQRDFLLQQGLLTQLQDTAHLRDPFHPAARRNRMIRQLLVGDRMGELFKVLILQKK